MGHEWKEGDRVRLEGVISEIDGDGDCWIRFEDGIVSIFDNAGMKHAKLIQPAAPEPQKLDVTKPIRVIGETESVVVIGPDQGGWVVSTPGYAYGYRHFFAAELENIPEPKRTTTQLVELVPFSDGIRIVKPGNPFRYTNIKSSAKVSYVEGEGWSIEEVAS